VAQTTEYIKPDTAAFTGHRIIAKAELAHVKEALDETIGSLIDNKHKNQEGGDDNGAV
jgi:hypothetical protein